MLTRSTSNLSDHTDVILFSGDVSQIMCIDHFGPSLQNNVTSFLINFFLDVTKKKTRSLKRNNKKYLYIYIYHTMFKATRAQSIHSPGTALLAL